MHSRYWGCDFMNLGMVQNSAYNKDTQGNSDDECQSKENIYSRREGVVYVQASVTRDFNCCGAILLLKLNFAYSL